MLRLKQVTQAIGLVAVLVMVLAVLGATQPPIGDPPDPFARSNIVGMLQEQFGELAFTASAGGNLLDFESAVLWSDGGPRLMAYIPPHIASEFLPRAQQYLAGEDVTVPFGGFYVGEDATDLLPEGTYTLWLRGQNQPEVVFIDTSGKEVFVTRDVIVDRSKGLPSTEELERLGRIPFNVTIRNNWCFAIKCTCAFYAAAHR